MTSTRDDNSDDEDDEDGWLTHSKFNLGSPPVSASSQRFTQRRPLSPGAFNVSTWLEFFSPY